MKILILKNKGLKQSIVDNHTKRIKEYYEEDAPKEFEFNPIEIEFTELSVDVPIKMTKIGTTTTGKSAYGADDVKRHIRAIVPENTYDIVYFFYDNKSMFSRTSYVAPFSYRTPLYLGTQMIQMPRTASKTSGIHELMHAIGNILGIDDVMDKTVVDGKVRTYYNNKYPLKRDSNYGYTWELFKPHLERLEKEVKEPMFVPITRKYKYFSDSEVKGLKPELVSLLDKARGIAGISFVINSGYRTVAHNKAVGGVANSAHLSGLAVDLRARNGAESYAIIKSAMEVGIKRIGINRKKNFIHLDVDYTKPTPTIYEY